jgi:hypothetical protein
MTHPKLIQQWKDLVACMNPMLFGALSCLGSVALPNGLHHGAMLGH